MAMKKKYKKDYSEKVKVSTLKEKWFIGLSFLIFIKEITLIL
jgi:hypothetical protein